MKKMRCSYRIVIFLLFLTIILFTGCDPGGDSGTLSNSVYLKNMTDGSKIYSGGSINLGTIDLAESSFTVTYRLVNDLGEDITLAETPDFVNFLFEIVYPEEDGPSYSTSEATAYENYFTMNQDLLWDTLSSGSESGNLVFTMNNRSGNYLVRRRYLIALSDDTGFLDFEFEVYGYFTS